MSDVTQKDRDLLELIYSGTFKFNPRRQRLALQEIAAFRLAAEKAVLDRLRNLPDDERRPLCERFGFHPQLMDSITTALADALETKR